MNETLKRIAQACPLAVMVQLLLMHALSKQWLDSVFEAHRDRQYTRELLFSTIVEVMSLVVLGIQPSLHAAARHHRNLGASLAALYAKVQHTELPVLRALVREGAERLQAVRQELRPENAPQPAGCQILPLDGTVLAPTEKRLAPLRHIRAAALPGKLLVVYDPEQDMILDIEPCTDAYVQERRLVEPLLHRAGPNQLWLGDANFCTRPVIEALHSRGAWFVLHEHGSNAPCRPLGPMLPTGRTDTGLVGEQPVALELEDGRVVMLRRIELKLDEPTKNGRTHVRLLTNAPSERISATEVAPLYRRRWRVEVVLQRLQCVLHAEVASLARPEAALLAFAVAILAYNALSVLQTTIEASHDLDALGMELSLYYLVDEVSSEYRGVMKLVEPEEWEVFANQTTAELCQSWRVVAAYLDPWRFRKNKSKNKAKAKMTPEQVPRDVRGGHVATAQVLAGTSKC